MEVLMIQIFFATLISLEVTKRIFNNNSQFSYQYGISKELYMLTIHTDSEIAVPAIQDQVYDCEADKQFLLSFLPQLRQCTERQKSKFRTQMCMTIEKILHGDDETTNQL